MGKLLDYNSNDLELTSLERIANLFDDSFKTLNHNKKSDEFDFTNDEKTWALEHTSYICEPSKEVIKYEKAREKGKNPDYTRIEGSIVDGDGELLAYFGNGMTSTRKNLRKCIRNKDIKCRKRLLKEPTFLRIDLAITVPDDPLFHDRNSIKPLDEFIREYNSVFNTIFVLFYNSLYIFNAKTGEYDFISYK